jgi:hypothetical protein
MQVIEAQCASILVPHDHLHISQMRITGITLMRPSVAERSASHSRVAVGGIMRASVDCL